ncbi:MAG: hypothetical protein ACFFC7_15250 [Candidatus Hermodarchaeota archaeon]
MSKLTNIDAKILLGIEWLAALGNEMITLKTLTRVTGLPRSTVSLRTRLLEGSNHVDRVKEGRNMYHFLTKTGKALLEEWKESSNAQYLIDRYQREIKENLKDLAE